MAKAELGSTSPTEKSPAARGKSQGQFYDGGGRSRPEKTKKKDGGISPASTLKGSLAGEQQSEGNSLLAGRGTVGKSFDVGRICDTELLTSSTMSRSMISTMSRSAPSVKALHEAPPTQIVLMPMDLRRRPASSAAAERPRAADCREALEMARSAKAMPRCASSPGLLRSQVKAAAAALPAALVEKAPATKRSNFWRQQAAAAAQTGKRSRHAKVAIGSIESEALNEAKWPLPKGFDHRATTGFTVSTPQGVTRFSLTQSVHRVGLHHVHEQHHEEHHDVDKGQPKDFDGDEGAPSQKGPLGMTLKEYFDSGENLHSSRSQNQQESLGRGRCGTDMSLKSPHYQGSLHDSEITAGHQDAHDAPCSAAAAAEAVAEEKREAIRERLVRTAGGAREAFRMIDLTHNQRISPGEFSDGMQRMGINWQEITGFSKIQDVFKLFDRSNNRHLVLEELFPELLHESEGEPLRMSTPEFWNHWCKSTRTPAVTTDHERMRSPKWHAAPDEELRLMCREADQRQDITDERRRMAAALRRLKHQGKSDARCRECIATHLPRGTGPKDRQDVQTFSELEVKACRRAYSDKTSTHVKNIQKSVFDMREQRKQLQGSRHQLWAVTREEHSGAGRSHGKTLDHDQHQKHLAEVDRKAQAAAQKRERFETITPGFFHGP